MTRSVITDKLLHFGINPANAGFEYLVEYINMLDLSGGATPRVMEIYKRIADNHGNVPKQNIERCIRHAISAYYDTHVDMPDCMKPYDYSGSMPVSEFATKLYHLFKEDTGYLCDGTFWALTEVNKDRYAVRIYKAGGNYTACRGTLTECIKFIDEMRREYVV